MAEHLRRTTTSESVADLLRRDIRVGELQPGERLRQSEIAKKYGVSTTPVREAFALLQAEGLVRIDPHKGALVFRPTVQDLTESYEIRGTLEALAVDKAMDRLTQAQLIELQEIIDEMRRTEDEDVWVELNNLFHLKIYETSGLPRLVRMIEGLRQSASAYIHLLIAHQDVDHRSNDEHQEILDACIARDHDRAREAITKHIESTIRNLIGFIDGQEHQDQPA